jgi:TPR repeat protein
MCDRDVFLEDVLNGKNQEKFINQFYKFFDVASFEKFVVDHSDNKFVLFLLGMLYENGKIYDYDPVKAMDYYKKSGHLGNIEGLTKLGFIHHYSQCDVKRDIPKAIDYYTLAVRLGGSFALSQLMIIYFSNSGTDMNLNDLIESYEKVVPITDHKLNSQLGTIYCKMASSTINYELASKYYNKSLNHFMLAYKESKIYFNDIIRIIKQQPILVKSLLELVNEKENIIEEFKRKMEI